MRVHVSLASRLLPAALLSLSLGALGACNAAPPVNHATELLPGGRLARVQPGDVAVLPVRNQTGRVIPEEALRDAFSAGLIDRLYSPLAMAYVDRAWQEASFGDAGAAEAVLQVSITEWDTSALEARGALVVTAEVLMFDPFEYGGDPLWGVNLTRRIAELDTIEGDPQVNAAQAFAREALEILPERDPVAASR